MPATGGVAIRLEDVSKIFEGRRALDHVTLAIEAGSYVALMGGNGAGKTTLLRVIAGLAAPTLGNVTVAGVDMRRAGPGLRARIGYVAHDTMLYGDLTAEENLRFHARLFELPDPDASIRRATDAVDVSHALPRTVRTLSRGTKQRVALARALLHEPQILLLDEPYTGLDEAASATLSAILETFMQPDTTIVVALHEMSRALAGSTRIVALDDGRLALDRPTHETEDIETSYRTLLAMGGAR